MVPGVPLLPVLFEGSDKPGTENAASVLATEKYGIQNGHESTEGSSWQGNFVEVRVHVTGSMLLLYERRIWDHWAAG